MISMKETATITRSSRVRARTPLGSRRVQKPMFKLLILAIFMPALVAGCGDVVVFGHVVHEGAKAPETKSDASPAVAGAPAASPVVASSNQSATPAANARTSTVHMVRAVNVSLAPAAAAKVAGDSNFGLDALVTEIKSQLRARKLLSEQDPNATGSAEVTIDDMSSHPTSNAVLFGYQMMAGTLTGNIRVDGAAGNVVPDFRIVAASRWNVAVAGDDKNPLKPLYHRFALLTGDRLAGVTSTDDSSANRDSD
jgi:hypothetical protein